MLWLALALPIAGGVTDTVHTAVGQLVSSDGSACSATLVASDRAITAAHCTDAPDLVLLLEDGAFAIRAIERHVTFDAQTLASDIAILTLAAPSVTPPIALHRAPLTGGETVTLVGFGRDETSGGGVRRSSTTAIEALRGPRFESAGACAGDSGGAVLVGGELAGVISTGDPLCGGASSHVRIGAFGPWLAPMPDAAPTVAVAVPASVPTVFDVSVTLADDHGALVVRVLVDGDLVEAAEVTGDAMTLELAVAPGDHVLELVAVDASHNEGRAAVAFFVEPPAPRTDDAGCSTTGGSSGLLVLLALASLFARGGRRGQGSSACDAHRASREHRRRRPGRRFRSR